MRKLAAEAKHPNADVIAEFRARGGNIFLNCRMMVAPGQRPVEIGPQCDDYQDGDEPVAQDENWTYLADGRRLRNRKPRS